MSKYLKVLIIVVVIIIIGGIAAVFSIKDNTQKESNNTNNTPNINGEVKNDEIEIDTDDWQVYENKKYGFSFKLPNEWKVSYEYGPEDVQLVNELNILGPGERNIFKPVAIVYLLDKENIDNLSQYIDKIFINRDITIEQILDNGGLVFRLKPDGQGPPSYKKYSIDGVNSGSLSTSGSFSFLYETGSYYVAIFGTESQILKEIAETVNFVNKN